MTAVSFSDLKVASLSGAYLFRACSPDNEGEARAVFQNKFRYSLQRGDEELWCYTQSESEPSPTGLYVGDDGHTVVRTHGYGECYLIARRADGHECARVAVSAIERPRPDAAGPGLPRFVDPHLRGSTAGILWSARNFGYFLDDEGPKFCIAFVWGSRLLLELADGSLLCQPGEALLKKLVDTEVALGCRLAEEGAEGTPDFYAAVSLLLRHRPQRALPLLRKLEGDAAEVPWWSSCYARRDFNVGHLGFRAEIALALRLLGEMPEGLPATVFFRGVAPKEAEPLPIVSERDGKLAELPERPDSEEVLRRLGAPDRVRSFSQKKGKRYHWGERWYYLAGLGEKTRALELTFKPGSWGTKCAQRRWVCGGELEQAMGDTSPFP